MYVDELILAPLIKVYLGWETSLGTKLINFTYSYLEGVPDCARLAPADGAAALVLADGVPAARVGHRARVGAATHATAAVGEGSAHTTSK